MWPGRLAVTLEQSGDLVRVAVLAATELHQTQTRRHGGCGEAQSRRQGTHGGRRRYLAREPERVVVGRESRVAVQRLVAHCGRDVSN